MGRSARGRAAGFTRASGASAHPRGLRLMAEQTFGRYRVTGELGRGAMGTVFRALDPLIEREVAIKTLLPNLPPDVMADVRERFLREAKSAGRLNHPNIVTIFDVGEQGDVAYIAMEVLEGRSLQEVLRESTRMPFNVIAELAAQVADALDHAHGYAIVHRDIKPANVMILPSGRAKLTDFGVAYIPSSTATQAGSALGSPRYMSPEQVMGQSVDPRSDIFSLGVVLYEMLTWRNPFELPGDSTIFALMQRIARSPHQPVTQIDPYIPIAFDHVLGRALAKTPEGRYQRASEMARELRDWRSLGAYGPAHTAAQTPRLAPPGAGNDVHAAETLMMPGSVPTPDDPVRSRLLEEFDAFERNVEDELRAHQRKEEQARERKEEELRRWADARRQERATFDRTVGTDLADTTVSGQAQARRAAIEALRDQAARPPADDATQRRAGLMRQIDQRLRAAHQYLIEFAAAMNSATPETEYPYELTFLRSAPAMELSEAAADYRMRQIGGMDYCDYVSLRLTARYVRPARFELIGADIQACRTFLVEHRIPFAFKETRVNDFGQPTRGVFSLSGPMACEAQLRGDYEALAVVIELRNIGRLGRTRWVVAPGKFDDELIDAFGNYVLGQDIELESRLDQ